MRARRILALACLGLGAAGCGGDVRQTAPDIILISADTLRADRLGAYGYAHDTSPHIDRLAREGLVFERAYAHSAWTLPSHVTIFTGLLPTRHRIDGNLSLLRSEGRAPVGRIPERSPTLAELLRRAGYATEARTEGGWVDHRFGFARGFDRYVDDQKPLLELTCPDALAALGRRRERPLFLFVHTYAAHLPYAMPERFGRRFAGAGRGGLLNSASSPGHELRNQALLDKLIGQLTPPTPADERALGELYDASVRHLDDCVGRLAEALRTRRRPAALVLLADHGEELYDHGGYGHGDTLYDEVLRVPLVVWAPGRVAAGRRPDPVGLVDVLATVLELAGAAPSPDADGRSLLAAVLPGRKLLARAQTRAGRPLAALIDGTTKFVAYRGASERDELFDLGLDPGERRSLTRERPGQARSLRERLQVLIDESRVPVEPEPAGEPLSDEARERLRALGYIQ